MIEKIIKTNYLAICAIGLAIISLILMLIDFKMHINLYKISTCFLFLSQPLLFGAKWLNAKIERKRTAVVWAFFFIVISVFSVVGLVFILL
ncbi:hypothetical protein FRZ06_07210 [Anoxybacterium hadale]|uniref:Uncharacterized protein n=1 Tax=Anoxybacterium hadale TaxID=3408580 RepID=A0ACD1AA02_9FIRM|nr:hypothetical protein FRZ06_07210 [Clostridiales bacterium]